MAFLNLWRKFLNSSAAGQEYSLQLKDVRYILIITNTLSRRIYQQRKRRKKEKKTDSRLPYLYNSI